MKKKDFAVGWFGSFPSSSYFESKSEIPITILHYDYDMFLFCWSQTKGRMPMWEML